MLAKKQRKPALKSKMIVTLGLILVVLFFIYEWITMKPKNFPPGPPYLPFVGSLPFLPKENTHFTLHSLNKRYGPVIGLMFGRNPAVAITGPTEIFEILKHEEFQARPDTPAFKEFSFNQKLGILGNSGSVWQEQRRFTLRHLRDFGFGKSSMEIIITDEVDELIGELIQNQTVQANGLFNISTVNVLWGLVAGKRYKHSDSDLKHLMEIWTFLFRSGQPVTFPLEDIFPILKRIAPVWTGYQKRQDLTKQLQDFVRGTIEEHQRTFDSNSPRDFIDVYLQEIERQHQQVSSFSVLQLIVIILDLFGAGAESSGNTLSFCLLYLILHPGKQKKAHEELDKVIGKNRYPTLEDRTRLPYIDAIIAEVTRINNIAPVTVPHSNERETKFHGYTIPKNTVITINLYSILHDQDHWGDPEVFRPERFLDDDGKFVKDDWLIPFGLGKRACLGEPLARSLIFIFLARLLYNLKFSLPEGDHPPSTVPLSGFTIAPQPFRVKIIQRK